MNKLKSWELILLPLIVLRNTQVKFQVSKYNSFRVLKFHFFRGFRPNRGGGKGDKRKTKIALANELKNFRAKYKVSSFNGFRVTTHTRPHRFILAEVANI